MKGDPDRTFAHPEMGCHIGGTSALDGNLADDGALPLGQAIEHSPGIDARRAPGLNRELQRVRHLVDIDVVANATSAQMVGEFVPRDRPQPRLDRPGLVPSVPLEMHGEQGFLHDIFTLRRSATCRGQTSPNYRPQPKSYTTQETAICLVIPLPCRPHQGGKIVRIGQSGRSFTYSCAGPRTLQANGKIRNLRPTGNSFPARVTSPPLRSN